MPGSTIFDFLNNPPDITGRMVRLRPRRLEDAADQYRWRSDEELSALDASAPTGFSYPEFLDRYALELEYPGLTYSLAIDLLDNRHIGECSLFNFDFVDGSAETGIIIGEKDCWGLGYGSDALLAVARDTFSRSDLKKLQLRTLERNTRAQRCFEKCGFRATGNFDRGEYRFIVMELYRNHIPITV